MDLRSKFRGGLLGTGIGDSMGRSRESSGMVSVREIREIADKRDLLRYTDDTQQMISLAEALAEKGKFDGEYFGERLAENFDPARGYGPGSTQVIKSLEEGEPWEKPAQRLFGESGSYGNGSSMRVAPAGIFCYDNLENLRSFVRNCSRVTHAHRLGIEGAIFQASSVALATRRDPSSDFEQSDFLEELRGFIEENEYREKLERIKDLLENNPSKKEIVNRLGNGVEAFNSVPTAVYSFLSHPDSFEDAVEYAISLGGDADTIGAMAGASAGAYHGTENIPETLVDKLEDREKIEKLANELFEIKS